MLACHMYAESNGGYFPPAAADGFWPAPNLMRWHGVRPDVNSRFDPSQGPLAPYLEGNGQIKKCPEFGNYLDDVASGAFEGGSGGYGYNQSYLGGTSYRNTSPLSFFVSTRMKEIESLARVIGFTDAAFLHGTWPSYSDGVLIEYGYCDPPFFIDNWTPTFKETPYPANPSIHFRHVGRVTNVAWADGRVTTAPIGREGFGAFGENDLGWFGPSDSNVLFDIRSKTPDEMGGF